MTLAMQTQPDASSSLLDTSVRPGNVMTVDGDGYNSQAGAQSTSRTNAAKKCDFTACGTTEHDDVYIESTGTPAESVLSEAALPKRAGKTWAEMNEWVLKYPANSDPDGI